MDWSVFNWVDAVFAAVLVYGAVMGLARGLSHELATLIGMVVAVIVTRLGYEPVSEWICGRWRWDAEITRLAAVVVLALGALYGMRLLRIALGTLMTFSFKGLVERVGGLLTGVVRQGAIFLILLLAVYFVPSSRLQRAMQASATGQTVLPYLVKEYNKLADKTEMIRAEIPIGVELPQVVMPPLPEPGSADYSLPPVAPE